jgi:cell division protein FtsQ
MATRVLNPRRPASSAATKTAAGYTRARPARTPPRPRPAIPGPVLRRRLIAAAIGIVVLWAGYMLWFRNLALFSIDEVTVTGATTNAPAIKQAIVQVAGEMTTLHLNDDELRDTVAHFPTVASVGATTSFPHTLHVTVTERAPVAFVKVGTRRTAVSADGYLLLGASFDPRHLPRIETAAAHGARLDGDAAAQAAILGGTPAALRDHVTGSTWDDEQGGVVVSLDGGPDLRFGDGSRARDKWTSAAAVLSSPEHGSPSYLDVSVPDRPVSGG